MSRTTFYGFGAFVGSISGLTMCSWWDDDPIKVYNFAPGALMAVDLAMNLSAARAGTIQYTQIQVDDHRQDGGLTTIGPMFPTGAMIGACWLAETYYQTLTYKAPRQPTSAPNDAFDYELTCHQYWDGELGDRRFHGFHANVLAKNGPLTQLAIWHGGTGRTGQPAAGIWWLDLAQVALPGSPASGPGPVFLDAATKKLLGLREPKRPVLLGL